jgi:hypothetical protein
MEDQGKKSLSIKFTKSPDYRVVAATGAWGGLTPQGELFCNLFIEHNAPPESVELEVGPISAKEVRKISSHDMVREFQVGIVMRPDIAKSIGEWLVNNAEKAITPHRKMNS